jgi:hypothetical protein
MAIAIEKHNLVEIFQIFVLSTCPEKVKACKCAFELG